MGAYLETSYKFIQRQIKSGIYYRKIFIERQTRTIIM